jgi:hypothetical protein
VGWHVISIDTLRDRLMVGQRTLDPFIGVRIPVPQQNENAILAMAIFIFVVAKGFQLNL